MIFQQFNLVGRLSALENVLTARLSHRPVLPTLLRRFPREDYERAMGCLRRVGLADRAAQRADTLSGGERQRVAIARALAQEPRILLADEPVASLDPGSTHQVLELIRRVSREDGLTVLMSLHQVGLARQFSDRVAGLAGGRLVFEGSPDALDDMALAAIYGEPPDPEENDGRFDSRGGPGPRLRAGRAPAPAGHGRVGRGRRRARLGRSRRGPPPSRAGPRRPYMADFLRRMFPPNLDYAPALVGPTLETLQMAIWGTVLAIGLAAPLGILAARNLTPHPACFWAARGLLNAMRGSTAGLRPRVRRGGGPGPLPGVLALAVHTAGMLGKFYAEAMEGVDPGPVEALAATGAGRLQTIRYAVLPQVMPAVVAFNLYRLEVSVRSATVLGLVGAGGDRVRADERACGCSSTRRGGDPRRDRRPGGPDRCDLHARPQALPVRRLPCACRSWASRFCSPSPRCSRPRPRGRIGCSGSRSLPPRRPPTSR